MDPYWRWSHQPLHHFIVLLRPAPPPLATQSNRAIVSIERKPSVPVAEKISQRTSEGPNP